MSYDLLSEAEKLSRTSNSMKTLVAAVQVISAFPDYLEELFSSLDEKSLETLCSNAKELWNTSVPLVERMSWINDRLRDVEKDDSVVVKEKVKSLKRKISDLGLLSVPDYDEPEPKEAKKSE